MTKERHITDLSKHGAKSFFCRVQYERKIYNKSFAFKHYGGKRRALEAAKAWREKTKRKIKYPEDHLTHYTKHRRLKFHTIKHGKDPDLPVGVYRGILPGWDYADLQDRLVIYVNWRDHWDETRRLSESPRTRMCSFRAGIVGDIHPEVEKEAERCACEMRAAYVRAVKARRHFDADKVMARLRARLESTRRKYEHE